MSTSLPEQLKELLTDMGFRYVYEYNDLPGWIIDLAENILANGWVKKQKKEIKRR